jgi:hypothetical protein
VRRLAVVLAVALTAVSVYAVTAPAGSQQVSPRQVASLQRQVRKLQAFDRRVRQCLFYRAVPVTRYHGYVYRATSNSPEGETSAFDLTQDDDRVTWYAISTRPGCVQAVARFAGDR